MLPGLDGLSMLKSLRAAGNSTPVLILTAVGETLDRVEGLRAGADDYLPKPFALSELEARRQSRARKKATAHRWARTRSLPPANSRTEEGSVGQEWVSKGSIGWARVQ